MATRKISNPRTGQVVEAEVVNIAQLTDPPPPPPLQRFTLV